ncbi:MAG: helix-turn-helix transcriptional regulator [Streptosporangiales bacterium]
MTDTLADEHPGVIARSVEVLRTGLHARLTLTDLGDAVGYSPFHLARLFRSTVGVPPGEFRRALRFERAKQLLLRTDLSVTDVCFEVGFNSLGTFSSRFSKLVGVNPVGFQRLPDSAGDKPAARVAVPGPAPGAVVRGRIEDPGCDGVYVGLFPQAIAQARPVAGAYLPGPGPFEITGMPIGSYRLLAAGFPAGTDALWRLLPDARTLVGAALEPCRVRTGGECLHRDVRLRAHDPTEPPVLVALAALSTPHDPGRTGRAR